MSDKNKKLSIFHPLMVQNQSKFMNLTFSGYFGQIRDNFGQFHLGKWFFSHFGV